MAEDLSEKQNFLLGTIAAFIEGVILQPTLYWKNAKAQNLPFTLDPRLLYRGTAASIFNECQMMGLQFGFTKFYQDLIANNGHLFSANGQATDASSQTVKLTRTQEFLSASASGITVALFSSPVELVMIQQQRFGGSFLRTPARIMAQHGFFAGGIMRAYSVAAARDAIYVCGMLGITPILQTYLMEKHEYSISQASLVASLAGGAFAAVPSHPFDVVKTCLQGDLQRENYQSIVQTAKKLAQEKRLFSGCMWRSINIIATVYIANECRNYLSPFIKEVNI